MKLQRDKIDTIIFDMDGVITSELGYWKAAALTVYELMYDYRFYGKSDIERDWCYKHVDMIYDTVFNGGKTVTAVKNLGVNTNWDLAYVVFCVAKYLDPTVETFDKAYYEAVCMFIENMEVHPPEIYTALQELLATVVPCETGHFQRGESVFWTELVDCFQRWYHGDDEISGLKELDEPLLSLEDIKGTLETLKAQGFQLGIGTGRPKDEIVHPLKMWGLDTYFTPALCATYDDVLAAQSEVKVDYPLAKPHPFVFLKAAFGAQFSNQELCDAKVKKEMASRCLVVGDAASDMLAAKTAGFPFLAVLTGVTGQRGRQFFEEHQADIILDTVLDMKGLITQ